MNTPTLKRRRGRLHILVLAMAFAAPLGFAFWLYYGSSWRPLAHTNHGTLIEPVRTLPDSAEFLGKWSLVVIGSGEGGCDSACRESLVYARQTWLSLGKNTPRAQRVLLSGSECCDETYLQREHHGLIRVAATGPGSLALRQSFPAPQAHTIFIVDPLGNLMMRYDTSADPKGLREDLKKLLDLSHIG
jgi:hypothetical protein